MIDVARIKVLALRQIYESWLAKTGAGRLPSRLDLHPRELPTLLRYVFLLDVEQEPLAFRFRLVGTELTRWAGAEYSGFLLQDGKCGPTWQIAFDGFRGVVDTCQPRHCEQQAPWVSKWFHDFESVVMPLSTDGTNIDMLFGALHVL
jgi:hypothetical protein